MWAEHAVSNMSFRRPAGTDNPARFALDIRLNWSRSIPMSCVEEVALKVDGELVATGSITLAQKGEDLPLEEWRTRDDIWWPVLEPSTVTATAGRRLSAGWHEIELELRVRIPAFPPGPDGVWPTRYTRVTVSEQLA